MRPLPNEARQKLKIILDLLPITSSLGKVPRHRGGGPSDPLVGGLEPELEPTDQGIPVRAGHTTTARRLEPSRGAAFKDLRVVGVYPIFDSVVEWSRRRCWFLVWSAAGLGREVVETRRLELLTLSLQRRCSSS
jgi:hypothetical protein